MEKKKENVGVDIGIEESGERWMVIGDETKRGVGGGGQRNRPPRFVFLTLRHTLILVYIP